MAEAQNDYARKRRGVHLSAPNKDAIHLRPRSFPTPLHQEQDADRKRRGEPVAGSQPRHGGQAAAAAAAESFCVGNTITWLENRRHCADYNALKLPQQQDASRTNRAKPPMPRSVGLMLTLCTAEHTFKFTGADLQKRLDRGVIKKAAHRYQHTFLLGRGTPRTFPLPVFLFGLPSLASYLSIAHSSSVILHLAVEVKTTLGHHRGSSGRLEALHVLGAPVGVTVVCRADGLQPGMPPPDCRKFHELVLARLPPERYGALRMQLGSFRLFAICLPA
ncbi:hypothetical protein EYF80_051930 [Liparis tanakae]|uniref:Uncharacterized protein n=1 Tax=Liparis tanakae TaxID=230148 RepID=A0A4Z2FAW7_9TELE|nr:hypothetical protein EYF80_051930 [Liparis tanakae]